MVEPRKYQDFRSYQFIKYVLAQCQSQDRQHLKIPGGYYNLVVEKEVVRQLGAVMLRR